MRLPSFVFLQLRTADKITVNPANDKNETNSFNCDCSLIQEQFALIERTVSETANNGSEMSFGCLISALIVAETGRVMSEAFALAHGEKSRHLKCMAN